MEQLLILLVVGVLIFIALAKQSRKLCSSCNGSGHAMALAIAAMLFLSGCAAMGPMPDFSQGRTAGGGAPSSYGRSSTSPSGEPYVPLTRTDRRANLADIRLGLTLLGMYHTKAGSETPLWAQAYAEVESRQRIKAGFCGIYYPITRSQASVACEVIISIASAGSLGSAAEDYVERLVRARSTALADNPRFVDAIVGVCNDV